MKHWLKISVLLILLPFRVFSLDSFEGKIKIVKESIYDTVQIEISIKGDIVRIDEINTQNIVFRSYLVNLPAEKVYVLSHNKKLYTEIMINPTPSKSSVEFIKTQNSMEVNGILCYQWRVRDKSKNSEVTYWVASQDLGFMKSLVSIISRSESPLAILGLFPPVNGYFPLLSVDRTLLRKVKESVKVIDIKSAILPANLFIIPPDFRELLS